MTDTSCFDNADRLTAFNPAAGANPFGTLPLDLFLLVVGSQAEAAFAAGLGGGQPAHD